MGGENTQNVFEMCDIIATAKIVINEKTKSWYKPEELYEYCNGNPEEIETWYSIAKAINQKASPLLKSAAVFKSFALELERLAGAHKNLFNY